MTTLPDEIWGEISQHCTSEARCHLYSTARQHHERTRLQQAALARATEYDQLLHRRGLMTSEGRVTLPLQADRICKKAANPQVMDMLAKISYETNNNAEEDQEEEDPKIRAGAFEYVIVLHPDILIETIDHAFGMLEKKELPVHQFEYHTKMGMAPVAPGASDLFTPLIYKKPRR